MGKVRTRFRLPLLGTLNLFVIREVMAPTLLGFVTYTFLMLMRPMFKLMEQIFVQGVAFKDGIYLLWLGVPQLIVMTIPMAFLFGSLIALGRMNSDNEIIAFQAAGISLRRMLAPLMLVAVMIAGFNAFLTLKVNPDANVRLRDMKTELFASARTTVHVEPRVFFEELPNMLLYVHDMEEKTGFWRNVVLYDRTNRQEERLTLARRGRLVAEIEGENGTTTTQPIGHETPVGDPWLLLENAVTHQFIPSEPETYRVNANQSQLHKLFSRDALGSTTFRRNMRERSSRELLELSLGDLSAEHDKDKLSPELRESRIRTAGLELHRRLAIPTACIVFGLLALPLGIGSRSGGRGRGFVVSILVVLVYYVVLNHGELLALEGRIPVWLGTWFPNMFLAAAGLFLIRWMGRWLGERGSSNGGWLTRALRRWQENRLNRRIERGRTGSIPVSVLRRRYATRFPALLDRYVIRRLAYPFGLVLLSTSSLYIIVDLTDHIDEMAKNKAPLDVILGYYWNLFPQTLLDVTPIGLMISVLILLTVMERQYELTALKAAGLSLYRLIIPVMLFAAVVAGGLWMLEESVLPSCRRESNRLLDRIKGRETTRSYRFTNRVWLMSREGSTLYNFMSYDIPKATMHRFTTFRFDEAMELRFHLFAHRVRYDTSKGAWIASSGWFRQIFPDGTDKFERITSPMELDIPESPRYFGQELRLPTEMTFADLNRYIGELAESGYQPVNLMVSLHQKLTYPLSAFVMVFLAMPFALNRGGQRVTTMQSIALALALAIGYFVMVAVFGKMGEAAFLPAFAGAWLPILFAALFAINRLTTLRT
jgi:LPS export ABC transporter permease LptG